MAFGPTLGSGIFIASGEALATGGPLSLLLSYVLLSGLAYNFATTTAEVSSHLPIRHGTMYKHGFHYASPSLGFAMALLRWYTSGIFIAYEITTAMVNLGFWSPGGRTAIRIALVTAIITGLNFLPERMYTRTETVSTGVKFVTILGLLVASAIICLKDNDKGQMRGFTYWHDPGMMRPYLKNGVLGYFLGLLQCLLYSSIAFTLTPEQTVSRAEEAVSLSNMNIRTMTRRNSLHLFILYFLHALAVGMIVPYDAPGLTNGNGAGYSPYVLGLKNAQIADLPSMVTILILLSSVGSGRSFLHLSSRMLCSLSESGQVPAALKARNRWGVPYIAVLSTLPLASFALLSIARPSFDTFNWLMHFVTASGCISWICSGVVYLRFRRHHHKDQSTTRRRRMQLWASYLAISGSVSLLVASLSVRLWPATEDSQPDDSQPVATAAAIVTFSFVYLAHRLVGGRRPPINAPDDVDFERMERAQQQVSSQEPDQGAIRESTTPFWWRKVKSFIEGPYGLALPPREDTQEPSASPATMQMSSAILPRRTHPSASATPADTQQHSSSPADPHPGLSRLGDTHSDGSVHNQEYERNCRIEPLHLEDYRISWP